MGPSILFDKSAIQALAQDPLHEVGRYFFTVVPPVLLMETLADLSLAKEDFDVARKKVAVIAKKTFPNHSIANADYRSMCIHNLLGEYIPMNRTPAVLGGEPVTATDGTKGMIVDVQPENEAVLRWRNGMFNEADMEFALEWRACAKGTNLEAMKQALPKPPVILRSVEQVVQVVDLMLAEPELKEQLLNRYLEWLECPSDMSDRVRLRWKWSVCRSLQAFAPYAYHCLRVRLVFYTGMIHGIFGTRSSNVVDLEYLYYTPFAFIFCSGDKLHAQLAPLILDRDQSFVDRDALQRALSEVAEIRRGAPNAEPPETSLVRQLWHKHWNKSPSEAGSRHVSDEESQRIMEALQPIIETLRKLDRQSGPRFPA